MFQRRISDSDIRELLGLGTISATKNLSSKDLIRKKRLLGGVTATGIVIALLAACNRK